MPLIRHLEISRYKSTETANRSLSKLAQASGWRDDLVTRLAIARSLRESVPPELVSGERKGKELRGETFFHSTQDPAFLPWAAAMIAEHKGEPYADGDEAFELIIAHWHRGIALLDNELVKAGGDFTTFLLHLARQAAELAGEDPQTGNIDIVRSNGGGTIKPVTVPIGRVRPDVEPITVTLNDTRKYSNCHVAISGMSGSGKTQLAMQMLASIAKAINRDTGIIFIDFAKGDVAGNSKFAASIGARVIRLPGDILPVGPFHLPSYATDAVRLAAEEKREVYSNLFPSIGPKQQGRLVDAILSAYDTAAAGTGGRAPDLALVADELNRLYTLDGLQPDSLTELFRRLNAYRLFWSRSGGESVVSPLYSQRWLIDIHELSGLKEVTAFTLIEQLYREMRALPDSQIDSSTGYRQMRCVLAIDEAQYYLKAKNRFLQGIIREGRSKGFAVMLMCQSPDDFEQADFDYTEQLQFTYMLQCKTSPKSVTRLLGVGREDAKRLSVELGRMEPLHGVGRGTSGSTGLSRFRVVPFFEL